MADNNTTLHLPRVGVALPLAWEEWGMKFQRICPTCRHPWVVIAAIALGLIIGFTLGVSWNG